MPRSTSKSNPPKWVLALCREMQTSIGHQLQIECKLPQELAPELSALWLAWTKKSSEPAEIRLPGRQVHLLGLKSIIAEAAFSKRP